MLERGNGIFNWKGLLQRVQAMFEVALLTAQMCCGRNRMGYGYVMYKAFAQIRLSAVQHSMEL